RSFVTRLRLSGEYAFAQDKVCGKLDLHRSRGPLAAGTGVAVEVVEHPRDGSVGGGGNAAGRGLVVPVDRRVAEEVRAHAGHRVPLGGRTVTGLVVARAHEVDAALSPHRDLRRD